MYSSYGELCTEVYDLSKPLGYSFGDVEYYKERLSDIKGKVLEVGCGSGRILIPLLQSGIQIEGLDSSGVMLNSCRSRCSELGLNPKLYEGEIHDFYLKNKYEAIIIPSGSFQLIEGREQAIIALKHFTNYLTPGGKLIMDLFIPTEFNINSESTSTWNTPNNEVIVLEDKLIEVNLLEQKTISLLKYEKWKNGKLLQNELQRFPLMWYGYHEFSLLLESIGYQDIIISTDYKYEETPTKAGQMITYEAVIL